MTYRLYCARLDPALDPEPPTRPEGLAGIYPTREAAEAEQRETERWCKGPHYIVEQTDDVEEGIPDHIAKLYRALDALADAAGAEYVQEVIDNYEPYVRTAET